MEIYKVWNKEYEKYFENYEDAKNWKEHIDVEMKFIEKINLIKSNKNRYFYILYQFYNKNKNIIGSLYYETKNNKIFNIKEVENFLKTKVKDINSNITIIFFNEVTEKDYQEMIKE